MKQYYMLTQDFHPSHKALADYLDEQDIKYTRGADFADELRAYGYSKPCTPDTLIKTYEVLIDEHELSAIKLSVDGVDIVNIRKTVKLRNKIRGYFSWILD